jgi:hypothetical protein
MAATLRRCLAVVRKSIFRTCVVVALVLGESAVGIYFLRGALWWVLVVFAAVVVLGVCAAGIYLLLGVIHMPSRRTREAVAAVVLLGVLAVGIYFLHSALRWAAVVGLLGVCAWGIYLLWGVIRGPDFLNWSAVVVALCVCGVGVYLLWGVWDGVPVAAAFTRVGGATRVETSLEASRFWLTPPQCVVETQATDAATMFAAAQYAVKYDAPLLFTSGNSERNKLVSAKVTAWMVASGDNKPPIIVTFTTLYDISGSCLTNADPANINGVSTLKVPNQPLRLRHVTPRNTLAPVVVFAAAIEPGNPSDVAVGLALAAHMAEANHKPVSLVVIPHYLESDQELEHTLERQHELVAGGVVLGETPTVPEDTRVLLRQLLTSTDRQGVAAQLQANLGSVGSLIAALLALGGLIIAVRIAGPEVIVLIERAERERPRRQREKRERIEVREQLRNKRLAQIKDSGKKITGGHVKESDWLAALGGSKDRDVIIWLRSGRQVVGTIASQFPKKTSDATVLRIKKPSAPSGSPPRRDGEYVLVSVSEIEMIHFNEPKQEQEKAPASEAQP